MFQYVSLIFKPKLFLVNKEEIQSNFSTECSTTDEILEYLEDQDKNRTLIISAKIKNINLILQQSHE